MWKAEVITALTISIVTLVTCVFQLKSKASASLVELMREQIKSCTEKCEAAETENAICNADRKRLNLEMDAVYRRLVIIEYNISHTQGTK